MATLSPAQRDQHSNPKLGSKLRIGDSPLTINRCGKSPSSFPRLDPFDTRILITLQGGTHKALIGETHFSGNPCVGGSFRSICSDVLGFRCSEDDRDPSTDQELLSRPAPASGVAEGGHSKAQHSGPKAKFLQLVGDTQLEAKNKLNFLCVGVLAQPAMGQCFILGRHKSGLKVNGFHSGRVLLVKMT